MRNAGRQGRWSPWRPGRGPYTWTYDDAGCSGQLVSRFDWKGGPTEARLELQSAAAAVVAGFFTFRRRRPRSLALLMARRGGD